METINITPLVDALIKLAAVVISLFVIPVLRRKIKAQDIARLESLAKIAVEAAEQLYTREATDAKRQYVLSYLESKGYAIDDHDVMNALEAAVIKLHAELYGTQRLAVEGGPIATKE